MNTRRSVDPSAEMDHQLSVTAALRGSGRLPVSGALPKPGELLRDFTLPAADGTPARLADLRGQSSLVLVFTGALPLPAALQPLLAAAPQYAIEDAKLVAVVAAPLSEARQLKPGAAGEMTVLADPQAAVHRQAGADRSSSAVYVTDRFGEIFAAWRTAAGDMPPPVPEVLRTLRQINLLCPECGSPEWPEE